MMQKKKYLRQETIVLSLQDEDIVTASQTDDTVGFKDVWLYSYNGGGEEK